MGPKDAVSWQGISGTGHQEVNARISQRQQALALYVTLVVSLLAALVAFRPGPVGSDSAVKWLLLGFPLASVCLAALNYKAERAITNLRRFLSALEQLGDGHHLLPSQGLLTLKMPVRTRS